MAGDPPADEAAAVPSEPPSPPPAAIFYDGTSNRRRHVRLDFGLTCNIIEDDQVIATWPFVAIRRADGIPGVLRAFCSTAPSLARLEIRDETIAAQFLARCEKFDDHRLSSRGVVKIIGWSIAATASIVVMVMYGLPALADRLAPLIPDSYEHRIGDVADRQLKFIFPGRECRNAEGRAAFVKLVGVLRSANNMDANVDAVVIDSKLANALALPGGKVYLLSALLDKAEGVDEIAGILAHELGHVRHRDAMRNMIYSGGTAFLFGLVYGDVTGGTSLAAATRTLFNASYSRDVESSADDVAIDTMLRLGRSPKPMGELMFRITGKQGDIPIGTLANHPLTEDRQTRLSSFDRPPTSPPILSDDEWKALKAICK